MEHSSITLTQLYEYFDVAALVEGATKKRCRSATRQMVKAVGNIQADSVTVPMIGQYQLAMKTAGLAVATIRSYFASMSEVYSWAVNNGVLRENPFSVARKMRPVKREVQILTDEDVRDFCDAACEKDRRDPTAKIRWNFILEIASTSGLRAGEIQNLRWDDIDLDRGTIHVVYRPDAWGEYWTWGTKGKTDRTVPMSQGALEAAYRMQEATPWRYPVLKQKTCLRLQREVGNIPELIRKQPYTDFYRELGDIRAIVNSKRKVRGLPPLGNGGIHLARRTAVSRWARNGVPMADAQYAAGHQSMMTTRNYYIAVDHAHAIDRVRAAIA